MDAPGHGHGFWLGRGIVVAKLKESPCHSRCIGLANRLLLVILVSPILVLELLELSTRDLSRQFHLLWSPQFFIGLDLRRTISG